MKYPIILMDADDTLLDFHRSERQALEDAFTQKALPWTPEIRERYQQINTGYWKRYEQGKIDKSALLVARFADLFGELGMALDPAAFNRFYLEKLGSYAFVLPFAAELCRRLAERHLLAVVTNGNASVQNRRLEESGLKAWISKVYISEEVGCQKPDPAFFQAVLEDLGNPEPSRVILLGDSQSSDMTGGKNAGLVTCWYNPHGQAPAGDWDYTIRRLEDFLPIAEGETEDV